MVVFSSRVAQVRCGHVELGLQVGQELVGREFAGADGDRGWAGVVKGVFSQVDDAGPGKAFDEQLRGVGVEPEDVACWGGEVVAAVVGGEQDHRDRAVPFGQFIHGEWVVVVEGALKPAQFLGGDHIVDQCLGGMVECHAVGVAGAGHDVFDVGVVVAGFRCFEQGLTVEGFVAGDQDGQERFGGGCVGGRGSTEVAHQCVAVGHSGAGHGCDVVTAVVGGLFVKGESEYFVEHGGLPPAGFQCVSGCWCVGVRGTGSGVSVSGGSCLVPIAARSGVVPHRW
ncbi:Uncharacterised protein [Mycobacteroides abscessus subsp. abscessus]|nr:Uncharacterised protein [Mycobacteroides abscessus subsp. abscessus]